MLIYPKYVKTSLDFFPNFENDLVKVAIGDWGNNEYYVLVCGQDDIFVQTEELTLEEAERIFNSIEKMDSNELIHFHKSSNNNGYPGFKYR